MQMQSVKPSCGLCPLNPVLRVPLRPLKPHRSLQPAVLSARPLRRYAACRTVVVRAAAANAPAPAQRTFGFEQELDGLETALSGLPTPAATVGAALLVAVAVAGGAVAGGQAPVAWRTLGRVGGGLIGAAAGAFCIKQLQEKRAQAASIMLQNLLAAKEDPGSLTRQEVEALNSRFGIDIAAKQPGEVARLYSIYLESIIPRGDAPLTGYEPEQVRSFKEALGLTDMDAAPVHLDVGRRLVRSSYEAGSREANALEKKTFQKLIFVSNLVFGDQQAAFLLPWERTFKLTKSQLQVALRDSGKSLFKAFLESRGGQLEADRDQLKSLRTYQQQMRLSDDVATEIVKDALRARVEGFLDAAIEASKKRTKGSDAPEVIANLEKLLEFNQKLDGLVSDPEVIPGLGRATVSGGKFDASKGPGGILDLRNLFRIYLEESLKNDGQMDRVLEGKLADLQLALALRPADAKKMRDEVVSATYKRMLREEFRSGRLKAAPKKAEVLQNLCDRLGYDSEAALDVHKSIFTERIETFLVKQHLTEEEHKELVELRKMLCLTSAQVDDIEKTCKGRIFQEVVKKALGSGIEHFDVKDRMAVRACRQRLYLKESVAKQILSDLARQAFLALLDKARKSRDRNEAAIGLKKLVFYSGIVVEPLLRDLKSKEELEAEQRELDAALATANSGDAEDPAMKEFNDTMAEAKAMTEKEEGENQASDSSTAQTSATESAEAQPATLRKAEETRRSKEELAGSNAIMRNQRAINLRADLDPKDRADVYRSFLLYCITGQQLQVKGVPANSPMQDHTATEFTRLAQLGDILGLNQMEIAEVHQELAIESFKYQVQTKLADSKGEMTPEITTELKDIQQKLGITNEAADKIIQGMQNGRMLGGLQGASASKNMTLEKLVEMAKSGVDVASFTSEDKRAYLLSVEMQQRLSDGKGEFDGNKLLIEIPKLLDIPQKKVDNAIKILTKEKRRVTLVQAVSMLRQKKVDDLPTILNNLVSLDAATPNTVHKTWDNKSELQDLYCIYCGKETDPQKRSAAAKTLEISADVAAQLQETVASGSFKLGREIEEESESFF